MEVAVDFDGVIHAYASAPASADVVRARLLGIAVALLGGLELLQWAARKRRER
ncbi:hypothetical protein [Amycolatopsis thermophila]|uniref:Uncharacterized protein n=1 Tax=Amycolatopsis thermophila TaxID=206084 RepID=A0ABU0EMU6_9PSEU|nr:hypothetical protein [Amycolatopsis thermophila]MDQ0376601.1 hypothetical protein [Amycolatopsis thermophila]